MTPPGEKPALRFRWLPFVIIGGAFALLMQRGNVPHIDPIMCDVDLAANQADVIMLSASWCGYCRRARHFLVDENVSYCEYDIETSERGAELYKRGRHGAIPVLFIKDEVIVGFNATELQQALIAHDFKSLDDF